MRSARRICNIAAVGLLLLIWAAGGAEAQTQPTASMDVNLTILQGCSIGFDTSNQGGVASVSFGNVTRDNLAKGLRAAPVNLNVLCSNGAKNMCYNIRMSHGAADAGSRRAMFFQGTLPAGQGSFIQYDICRSSDVNGDGFCTQPWGDTPPNIYQGHWSGGDSATQIPVYVVVPPVRSDMLAGITSGSYSDTVRAQITYDSNPGSTSCPSSGN